MQAAMAPSLADVATTNNSDKNSSKCNTVTSMLVYQFVFPETNETNRKGQMNFN